MIIRAWQRLVLSARKRRQRRANQSFHATRLHRLRLEQLEDRRLLAPVVTGLSISSAVIDEDGSITVNGTFTNPGAGGSHTVTFDWGNNSIQTQLTLAPGVRTFSTIKRYFDENPSGTPSDTYTITATVFDGTSSGSGTATVTVNNIAPTVTNLTVASSVLENTDLTLSGTFHDQGTRDTHVITLDWGNPNSSGTSSWTIGQTFQLFPGTQVVSQDDRLLTVTAVDQVNGFVSFETTRRYRDDGLVGGNGTPSDDSLITVNVTDDDTGSGSSQRTVSVQNATPVVNLDPTPAAINEGAALALSGSFNDLGADDAFTLTVQWGNGLAPSTFELPSTRTLMTLLWPQDFFSSTDNRTLTIDTLDSVVGPGVFFHVSPRTYRDDGPSPGNSTPSDDTILSVTVTDDDAGFGSVQRPLTIVNVAPLVNLDPIPAVITEGTVVQLAGSFLDPGTDDVHTLVVQWGNGFVNSAFQLPSTRTLLLQDFFSTTDNRTLTIDSVDTFSGLVLFHLAQRTHRDDGPSPGNGTPSDQATLAVVVTDDDTGVGSFEQTLTVENVAPVVSFSLVTDDHLAEGTPVLVSGSFGDPGTDDAHTLTVQWGNGYAPSTFELPTTRTLLSGTYFSTTDDRALTVDAVEAISGFVNFHVSHAYSDDGTSPGNGTPSDNVSIVVTIVDDDAGTGSAERPVSIFNVNPSITDFSATSPILLEGQQVTVIGEFDDPGTEDIHIV